LRALFEGVRLLDACIASRRDGNAPPDTSAYEDEANSALQHSVTHNARPAADASPAASPDAEPSAAEPSPAESPATGETIYRFEFSPSKELSVRGIGVETVR